MSASQWKRRLEECQQKLADAIVAAQEWRQVANNRLELIRRVDSTLSHNLEALVHVGEIFGVQVILPDDVWTPTDGMDGGSVTMYIMGKLESVAEYQKTLLQEASTIQVTLNDTYDLACEAVTVGRPAQDLIIPSDTERVSEPSSPLREFERQTNDIPAPPPSALSSSTSKTVSRPRQDSSISTSGALALFNKSI